MESKEERTSKPVITSLCVLHSLDHSEMFTELYREEKRREEKRREEKRREKKETEVVRRIKGENEKERDRSIQ